MEEPRMGDVTQISKKCGYANLLLCKTVPTIKVSKLRWQFETNVDRTKRTFQ